MSDEGRGLLNLSSADVTYLLIGTDVTDDGFDQQFWLGSVQLNNLAE